MIVERSSAVKASVELTAILDDGTGGSSQRYGDAHDRRETLEAVDCLRLGCIVGKVDKIRKACGVYHRRLRGL